MEMITKSHVLLFWGNVLVILIAPAFYLLSRQYFFFAVFKLSTNWLPVMPFH